MSLLKNLVALPHRWLNATPIENLPREVAERAVLSNVAYMEPHERPQLINGLSLDPDFNCYWYCGYFNGNRAVLAFRGTPGLDSAEDLMYDAQMGAFGTSFSLTLPKILAHVDDVAEEFAKKHIGKKLEVTGHSLGGTRAMRAALHVPDFEDGDIFNAGAGSHPAALAAAGAVAAATASSSSNNAAAAGGRNTRGTAVEQTGENTLTKSFLAGLVAGGITQYAADAAQRHMHEGHERIRVHHILGDVLSANFPLGTHTIYKRGLKKGLNIISAHSLIHFLQD